MANFNLKAVIKWGAIILTGIGAMAVKIEDDKKDAQLKELWEAHEKSKEK